MKKKSLFVLLPILIILVSLPCITAGAATNDRGATVGNSVNYGIMAEENDVLYFIGTINSTKGIYAISADGEGKIQKSTLLIEGVYDNLQAIGGYLYYTRVSDDSSAGYLGLYRAKTDGSGVICLTKDVVAYQNILGGFIYYKNYSDNGRLYRMKTDGTKAVCLTKDEVGAVNVVGDNIYYCLYNGVKTLAFRRSL